MYWAKKKEVFGIFFLFFLLYLHVDPRLFHRSGSGAGSDPEQNCDAGVSCDAGGSCDASIAGSGKRVPQPGFSALKVHFLSRKIRSTCSSYVSRVWPSIPDVLKVLKWPISTFLGMCFRFEMLQCSWQEMTSLSWVHSVCKETSQSKLNYFFILLLLFCMLYIYLTIVILLMNNII